MNMRILVTTAAILATISTDVSAKADFACTGILAVTGYKRPTMAEAKLAAGSRWKFEASNQFGPSWAQLSRAKNKRYRCEANASETIHQCKLAANPCGPVAPQNLSPNKKRGVNLQLSAD